jgi:hypothetical protein
MHVGTVVVEDARNLDAVCTMLGSNEIVVGTWNIVSDCEQLLAQRGPEKAGATGNQYPFAQMHLRDRTKRAGETKLSLG